MICVGHQIVRSEKEIFNTYAYPYYARINAITRTTRFTISESVYVGTPLELRLKQLTCTICTQPSETELCPECKNLTLDDDLPVLTRQSCNYRDEDSPLFKAGWCDPWDPPCGFVNNAKRCHTNYILYIGRYNSLLKVGITGRGRIDRLQEQGMNEAVIFRGIEGLPTALLLEEFVSDLLGVPMRLTTEQKVSSFSDNRNLDFSEIVEVMKDVDELKHLPMDHVSVYPDLLLETSPDHIQISPGTTVEGNVVWIQGDLMILDTYESLRLRDLTGWEVDI